jgi:hypothetical protein
MRERGFSSVRGHVTGEKVKVGRKKVSTPEMLSPLWECPKCGAKLVTKNMSHSCGRYTLEALFAKSDPVVLRIFDRLAEMVRECGPVTIVPQKTRVMFQVRVRFLGCMPRKSYLLCNFEFARRRTHPRFRKIETYAPRWHGHLLRVDSVRELDDQVAEWIREAYAVGEQKPLKV